MTEATQRMTVKTRFAIILITLITGFALFGVTTLKVTQMLDVGGSIYQDMEQRKDLIADILPPSEYIVESYNVVLQLAQTTDITEINKLIQQLTKLKSDYETRHEYWQTHEYWKNGEELKPTILDRTYKDAQVFYTEVQQQFIPAFQSGNSPAASLSMIKIHSSYQNYRSAMNELMNVVYVHNENDKEQTRSVIDQYRFGLWTVFILSVFLAVAFTVVIHAGILNQLGAEPRELVILAKKIADGKYDSIHLQNDNRNSLMAHLKMMQYQILTKAMAKDKLKDEIMRVKVALDNVSTGVMIADNNLTIVYANKSVIKTLSDNEEAIRNQLPAFDSKKLIGVNIDYFHVNPAHQRAVLGALNKKYQAHMLLGGRNMVVFANPVIDENGKRLGTVAEWYDHTAEAAVQQEVTDIVVAAGEGNFSKRIRIDDKEGTLRDLGGGINQLMQTNESSLAEIASVLKALSNGDLTQKITSDYLGTFGQLKDDANLTVENITEIVHQIQAASESINSGAKEIAAGNNDLSQRTEEQAASLEETAASMTELTSTVQHNAENAKHANQLAVNATMIAEKGRTVVDEVVKTMESINESSRKVVEIISVIDNIAFQTNILALNAAVEAARAGEQGRGFAVVATEVRNLAQRAAAAAGEIKSLIGDSVDKVDDGSQLVAQAGKTMQEIVFAIQGVTTVMTEITSASVEQSFGISQVNQAIAQMDDVTQQNAALVEEAAASAELLEAEARKLTVTVANFKTL